ncbi:MAG: redoxin domain-containing protein [bacterium]|nr:redoxin domain-containing protein [bacterium]
MGRISRRISRHLTAILLVMAASVFADEPQTYFIRAGADSQIPLEGIRHQRQVFLSLADLGQRLPITLRRDDSAGIAVLCTTHDCRPVYWGDDQEMLVTDTAVYVSVEAVAEALGCNAKIKRKRDVYLTCAEGWPAQKVGAQTGERAPGFSLKASADSTVTLNDLLSRGPVVVAFVRSGQWDPLSRLLLEALESKLDSLRGAGCEVVAIHGYEPKTGAKWAAELKLNFPQLADNASAVMRGYEVFDQGHLPHCTVFLLDREGVILYRQEYGNEVTLPDLGPLMQKVRELKDEG